MVENFVPAQYPLDLEDQQTSPEEIISWAYKEFGCSLVVTSSFQTQSIPLLHMVSLHAPEIEVIFLETGFHFEETIRFRDHIVNLLGLRLRNLAYDGGHAAFLRQYGTLYAEDPDRCCYINKVDPLNRMLQNVDAWMTGIRRDQSDTRTEIPVIQRREDGKVKIAPLAHVTHEEIEKYRKKFQLPDHPLTPRGFKSIGCFPCTRKAPTIGDDRAGRWMGIEKTECGLHVEFTVKKKTS